jgi:TolA-binding protein
MLTFIRDYYYWVGNMYMSQGNLSEAKNMYRKGQESLKTEGHNISADMATCLYKLGVIALRDYYASNSDEMSKLAV